MTVEKAMLLGLILLSLVLVATIALLAIGLRQEIITKVTAPETPPEILGSWGSSPRCQTSRRLDAVQLRLAQMHDRLDVLTGAESENHTEAEIGAR